MVHFRMELNAVEFERRMRNSGKTRVSRTGQTDKVRGHLISRVAVAHPHRQFIIEAGEDSVGHLQLNFRRAVFAMVGLLTRPPKCSVMSCIP